jgi:transglutaminase-like putative cysteine protease
MSTRYRVVHRTTYEYSAPVTSGHTIAHLLPRSTPTQSVELATVTTDPPADHVHEFSDEFANRALYLSVEHPHSRLCIEATSECTVADANDVSRSWNLAPGDDSARESAEWESVGWESAGWETGPAVLHASTQAESLLARRCCLDSALVARSDELRAYGATSFTPGRPAADAYIDLIARINNDFVFDPTSTDISTPIMEVFAQRRGVCQDFAHLAIGCLRSLGLPARYVSGYIETAPPPGMDRLEGADASHAWCSLYLPGWGWLDADPTNDQVPPRRHVTAAWGRDYADVAPVHGVVFGPPATQLMMVSVDMRAL